MSEASEEPRLSGRKCPECGWLVFFGDEWEDDEYTKYAFEYCGQCEWETPS